MYQKYLPIAVTIILSLLTIVGDVFLKMASESQSPLKTKWFIFALIAFCSSPFGWIYVFKHLKLATVGALFSVFIVITVAVIGVTFFKESLNRYELFGIAMASASLFLLARFA